MTKTEKRRAYIIDTIWLTMLIGAFYLFMKFAFWPLSPILFAFLIAMLLQKPVNKIVNKTKIKKGFASTLCVLALVLILTVLFYGIISKIVAEVRGFVNYIRIEMENLPLFLNKIEGWISSSLSFLPESLRRSVNDGIKNLLTGLTSGSLTSGEGSSADSSAGFSIMNILSFSPLSGVLSTAKKLPLVFSGFIVMIISSIFMTIDYKRITNFIRRQLSPEQGKALVAARRVTISSLKGMAKAYFLILFTTFCEILIGLTVLKLIGFYQGGYIIAISLLTAALDILPILGTGTVLIPWAVYALISGNVGLGIGLLILYALIYVLRQILEPKLLSDSLGLPGFATIAAMYIGITVFGFIGLFLLPAFVVIIKILNEEGVIHLWKVRDEE